MSAVQDIALIVGAGSGLSASLARLCTQQGMQVAIAARDTAKLDALARETGASTITCDAASPAAVAQAVFDAAQMVGTFEKPLYVSLEPTICAHSRAEKIACTNCLRSSPVNAVCSPTSPTSCARPWLACASCSSCSKKAR